jgi:hypothetical protein
MDQTMKTATHRAAWSVVALGFVVGCGGTTFGVQGDGGDLRESGSDARKGSDAGGGRDAGEDARAVGCPLTAPAAGGACAGDSLECEYGNDPSVACDSVLTCTSGAWVVTRPAPSTPCSDMNRAACPAAYSDLTEGSSCPVEVDCYYPQARCSCEVACFTACVIQVDGGPNAKTWNCDVPSPPGTCPIPRPRIGSACSQESQQCDYGSCDGNVGLQCTDGLWQEWFAPCPE